MYFQLEVDYYSNEANKNKYLNFQLIGSIKYKNCFVAWTYCYLKVYFPSASYACLRKV